MVYHTHVPIELTCLPTSDNLILIKTPDNKVLSLLQFKKADGKTYIRFAPQVAGTYIYHDDGKEKAIIVTEYKGTNQLFLTGGLEVKKNASYISYKNGKPFFWLADTWWYGATNRMKWPQPFQQLVSDRKNKGFSVVQIVIGIPPETDAFSPDSKNAGGFPFKKDWSLNPAYFDEADKKIAYLVEQGIVPCIVGGWGHHIEWMGEKAMKTFWRELTARYAAYPVIFCLAGEIDVHLGGIGIPTTNNLGKHVKRSLAFLPDSLVSVLRKTKRTIVFSLAAKKQKKLLKQRMSTWRHIGDYIALIDPYGRPITAHVSQKKAAKELLGNPHWLSVDTIQSGHALDGLPFMVSSILENNNHCIINMEPWYEGIQGNFHAYYQRLAFWMCILSGAKGHSYGAHGLWQMENNDGFMSHWGKSFWKDALQFRGAMQVGVGKTLVEKYQWWGIQSDFSLISPCWTTNNSYGPVSGRIGTDVIFVYSPTPTKITLTLPSQSEYTILVKNPETAKTIQTLSGKKTIDLPVGMTQDVLYIAEKTTHLV